MRKEELKWMNRALTLAQRAADNGEVPVGAVLVQDRQIVGEGYNQSISQFDCSAHAEIVALRDAGTNLQTYRFPRATLYCTLEPCAMCAGAMLHARIERLVFAAHDPRAGAAGSVLDLLDVPELNHRVLVSSGLLETKCSDQLRAFFKAKR